MWVGDWHHVPAALTPPHPGKEIRYICTWGWMGPKNGLRKPRPATGIRSPDRPARSLVAIPTELPRPMLWNLYYCDTFVSPKCCSPFFPVIPFVYYESFNDGGQGLRAPWQCHVTSLTSCSRILLEKLTGSQLVKKFTAFYGTRYFITAFTSARHLSLSWASSIQSTSPHPFSRHCSGFPLNEFHHSQWAYFLSAVLR